MNSDPRRQIRRILESAAGQGSLVIQTMSRPEVTFRAYDEDGVVVGEIGVYLAEAADGWYMAVTLVMGDQTQLLVRDERIGDTHDEALEAAVLRANDAANELGYTADL